MRACALQPAFVRLYCPARLIHCFNINVICCVRLCSIRLACNGGAVGIGIVDCDLLVEWSGECCLLLCIAYGVVALILTVLLLCCRHHRCRSDRTRRVRQVGADGWRGTG